MIRIRMAALALAGCAAVGTATAASAQQQDVALVYRLLQAQQMVVNRAAGGEAPARVGDRLRNGDVVSTSPDTRAALRFTDDGSVLRVNPSSRVRIASGTEGGVVVRTLQLEFGELWTRVNRRQGTTLRVQTPAGVAAVKGTEFVVRVDSNGVTTVITLEGVVEFFNGAGRTDISAGNKVTVDSAAAPRALPATGDELRQGEGARGDEPGTPAGTWVEVQMRDASGQTRTLMLRLPADAVRRRLEGRP